MSQLPPEPDWRAVVSELRGIRYALSVLALCAVLGILKLYMNWILAGALAICIVVLAVGVFAYRRYRR